MGGGDTVYLIFYLPVDHPPGAPVWGGLHSNRSTASVTPEPLKRLAEKTRWEEEGLDLRGD